MGGSAMVLRSAPRRRPFASVVAVLATAAALVLVPARTEAISSGLVVSQVYGGGGNSGATYTHDFVELFNRGSSTVSIAGWSIQYASATGTGLFGSSATTITELPDVSIEPGEYFLVQEAQGAGGTTPLPTPDVVDPTPIAMAAGGGKVALVNSATPLGCNGNPTPCTPEALATVVDLVGYGTANFFEGSGPTPAPSNTTAALRLSGGCTETDDNAADFTTGAPTPRNTASPTHTCGPNADVIAMCGPTLTTAEGYPAARTVTASDADGTVVDLQVTDVTPSPAPGSIAAGDLVPAGGPGGTASAVVTVDDAVPPGAYTVTVTATNDDATPQTGSCSLAVNVAEVLPVGSVQGAVGDADDGLTHRSPFAPATGNAAGTTTVAVRAVVYERTLARTSAGADQHGIFLQDAPSAADGDPATSDGIFVFMGSFSTLLRSSGGTYAPQAGDEIVIAGRVSEFFNLTEFSAGIAVVDVLRTGVDLDDEVPAFEAGPPDVLAAANRYWERREGMRAEVPSGSLVVGRRDVFPSTADGEVWVISGDHPVAGRADAYARRVFRDPHPLDDDPAPFDNGNGYRIIMGSLGIKAAAGDNTALIAPARTFDSLENAPVGGVFFSFSKYQIMVEQQLELSPGVNPSANTTLEPIDRDQQYRLATYNLENLYDFRDDPFDGCDFAGNPGCPGVNPPFDYVPASEAAYGERLGVIAQQVIADLHGPDVLLVQEAEDQDICTVNAGALACGSTDDADGKPDTLQELALTIADLGGPSYDAAYDRDGADDRGITSAFLYRTDRVELLPAAADDPVLGSSPTVDYRGDPLASNTDVSNPKTLNADLPDDVDLSTGVDGSNVFTRAPEIGLFRIWQDAIGTGASLDLYAISNHFSSTPDARVGQRTEQARYNAAIADALQAANPDALVALGGDLNVYPRPDDPFAPGHPLHPSDQLGPLYDQGLENLWDVLVEEAPSSAYSYVFQGQTQTLDQLFVTPSLFETLRGMGAAHVNADWPADFGGDGPRGASDHDPQVAAFCLDVTAPSLSVTVAPSVLWPPNHRYVTVGAMVSLSDDADPSPTFELVSVVSNEPDDAPGGHDGNTRNDVVIVDADTFRLRAERSERGTGRVYTITYRAFDACGNATTATATVSVPRSM